MAVLIETDSLSNQNISSALAIGAYTATGTRLVYVRVAADQVAGNGDYVFYATLQIGGSGSHYRLIPITTANAASGVTSIMAMSGPIAMDNGDVLTVYLDGLAGDTTTPDTRVDYYHDDVSANVLRILDRIEYNRGHHTVTGNTYYVDGTSGNDTTGNGTRALPYKTITKALTACTSNNHDEIILLPNSGGGPTIITEAATVTISKNYVQIRGPGRDVEVRGAAGANKDVFNITANGVELSGFRITTQATASNGVTVSGAADFARLHRLWIENASQDAVQFNVANRCEVANCVIVAAGRDGVRVASGAGSGNYNIVIDSVLRDMVGSAINLQGSDASDCRIQRNVIRDNAVGVTIGSGVLHTVLTDNRIVNNTSTISDSGTATLQQWNFLSTDTSGNVTGSAGLTAQQVRDAMKLAPTAGAPDAGSVDAHLDDIVDDTGTSGVVLADNAITAAKIATDALGALELAADAAAEIAAATWAYATRTLTSTAAATTAAVSGSTLAITSRATYSATISGLTISASWEKIWFTLKNDLTDADASSTVQIRVTNPGAGTDGLLYLNGAAGTAAQGSLTVDQSGGTVAIVIADEATDDLTPAEGLAYDIKQLVSGVTTVLTSGIANITYTATAAVA